MTKTDVTFSSLALLHLEIELNGGFKRHFRLLTAAHDRQLARKGAIAGNHGWVVDERGFCSKTDIGCLDTRYVGPGKYVHHWFDRETDVTLYPADAR